MTTELDQLDYVLGRRKRLRLRVACPSQEFAAAEMAFGVCRWLSCSRGIWESLTLGAEPDLALIMLQAPQVGRGVLDFLFTLLPERARDARSRHALVEIDDARDMHLSEKVLARASLLARLRATLELARKHGHRVEGVSCYSSSLRMGELADRLGVELIDVEPTLLTWGAKSGSRQIFHQSGVRHPSGSYKADKTIDGLVATLNNLTMQFGRRCWIVKADYGFGSGHGNAIADMTGLTALLTASSLARILRPCAERVTPADYMEQVVSVGAIAEQFVLGGPYDTVRYPSALGYLRRDQKKGVHAMLLGVHDQVLGDAGDYVGCRYPADPAYRAFVAHAARKVMDRLATLGVTGHVGVDFIAVISPISTIPAEIWATEINLRQTGTTHPHMIVRAILPGDWNSSDALTGEPGGVVCYKATDSIISSRYIGISSQALITRLRHSSDLAFDPQARRGVIPHLWPALERCGKIGATFVADSTAECDALQERFVALLEDLVRKC
jgi:hypothetical protein